MFLELASAPRFELIPYLFSVMARRCDDRVTMIRATVHRVQIPSAKFAMLPNRFLDDSSLRFIEHDRFVDHPLQRPIGQQRLRNVFTFVPLRPAPFISR